MFSFLKKTQPIQVPAWASSFFTAEEYEYFMQALESMLKKRNTTYNISEGVVHLTGNTSMLGQMSLLNLAQTCKLSDPANWESLIHNHFQEMEQNADFKKYFESKARDFDYAKEFLAIRLFNREVVQNAGADKFVKQDFSGDAFAMLSFDLPQSVINVKPEQMQQWNKTPEELFEIGKKNIEKKYSFDFSRETINDFDIWFIQDEHHFVPNFLFSLNKYPALLGEYGSLIGIPHRHAAMIYPIENRQTITAVNNLPYIISGMFNEGPGSVSNHLFWYKDGAFISLPYEFAENKMTFRPTVEFVQMLEKLPAAED